MYDLDNFSYLDIIKEVGVLLGHYIHTKDRGENVTLLTLFFTNSINGSSFDHSPSRSDTCNREIKVSDMRIGV